MNPLESVTEDSAKPIVRGSSVSKVMGVQTSELDCTLKSTSIKENVWGEKEPNG